MKKTLFLCAIFQTIFSFGQAYIIDKRHPESPIVSPYEFTGILYGSKIEGTNYIKVSEFSLDNEITKRIQNQIKEKKNSIDEQFKRVYELIETSNRECYLRPGHLEGIICSLFDSSQNNNITFRLGLLDLAINCVGKNNVKQIDKDILCAVQETWICNRYQSERLKEDNLTLEWVFSLFARKEAFEAMGWKPMYDDGTKPKEPIKKQEPEIDPDEITITF